MSSLDKGVHSFIVRIWYEPRENAEAPPEWRGVIEHVASGQRQYFKNPDVIATFIGSFLEGEGFKLSLRRRLAQWLKRYE
jgi:hypothetical protein